MYVLPQTDKSVAQDAGVSTVLRLRGGVVAEHPLDVEAKDKMQEAACLTVLIDTQRQAMPQHARFINP